MLGDAIRKARELRGMSQQGLADESGVSRKHISELENGANITVEVLKKVARALKLYAVYVGDDLALELVADRKVDPAVAVQVLNELLKAVSRAQDLANELGSMIDPMASGDLEARAHRIDTYDKPGDEGTLLIAATTNEQYEKAATAVPLAKNPPRVETNLKLLQWDEVPPTEFIEGEWDYPQTWRGGETAVREGIAAGGLSDIDPLDETADVLNPTLRDVQSGRFGVSRVNGRSMEPRLHDGDLVLIDTFDKSPKPNRIMAIYQPGKGSGFGYLHKVGDTWILAKANAAEFPPVLLNSEFIVRGVVKKKLEESLD